MSDTILTANFSNYSSDTLNRDEYGWMLESGVSGITQQPPDTLVPLSGMGTLEYAQDAVGPIADGDAYIFCCWNTPSGSRFGLKLYAPVQVIGIGTRPYWYYMYDNDPYSPTIDWIKIGSPSEQFTWPTSTGYNIQASPVSNHATLTVSVMLQPLS